MSVWNWLTKSLGLLGKPYLRKNRNRKFGSASEYVLIQLEATSELYNPFQFSGYDFKEGEEFVIALTPKEFADAIKRAEKNLKDVQAFMEEKSVQNTVD